MMHGQKNIKLCNTELEKRVYQYKNIKIKLYKITQPSGIKKYAGQDT